MHELLFCTASGNATFNASDGSYQLTAAASDGSGFSTNASSIVFSLDTTPPDIVIYKPVNNSGSTNQTVTFTFNASDLTGIGNCSVIINGTINATHAAITGGEVNITVERSAGEAFNWSITCTDILAQTAVTAPRTTKVITLGGYSGRTTDLGLVTITNISNLIIENPSFGMINFTGILDISNISDLNSAFTIGSNLIEISENFSEFNTSAELSFYGQSFSNPQPLKNSANCIECTALGYSNGIFMLSAQSSGAYSAGESPAESVQSSSAEEATAAQQYGGLTLPSPKDNTPEHFAVGKVRLEANEKSSFAIENDKMAVTSITVTPQRLLIFVSIQIDIAKQPAIAIEHAYQYFTLDSIRMSDADYAQSTIAFRIDEQFMSRYGLG